MNILDGLNGPQREAVENYTGPTLIIAGAGSGKTRVLTMRIARMLQEGVEPRQILALTFTNKAAREMRDRVTKILPYEAVRGLWMGTFHSLFGRILRNEAEVLGFPSSFTIYDTADSRNVVKHIIRQLELPDEHYRPNDVFARISLAKNNLVLPEAYAANAVLTEEDARAKRPRTAEVYALYMRQCKLSGAMDFDDLLLYMNILLKEHPEAVQKYGDQFRYILVDEYQDTNYAQYLIVKKLADVHRNVCVVGDDSQSIYSFRGARIENILRFQKDYPDARIFKLEQNYRSTQTIVEAANSVIEKNSRKLPKTLFSENERGEAIRVFCALTDKEESQQVASDIHTTMYAQQAQPDDFAVMYRTNAQSRGVEEALRGKGIPYRVYGGQSFYQRAEIKDAIAYLRLAVNPRDDESLRRIINFPTRGIGDASFAKITAAASAHGRSIWETLGSLSPQQLGIQGPAVKSIESFVRNFSALYQKAAAGETDAYELAMEIMERSGLITHYRESKSIEDESRLQNIEELINSIQTYVEEAAAGRDGAEDSSATAADEAQGGVIRADGPVGLDRWLQEIALLTDQDKQEEDDRPKVTLLTVHAAKGLEFRYTYIVGMEENLFPSQRSASTPEEVEEERRLFYVALTRAQKRATLSLALSRSRWGGESAACQPSRFIKEIDPQYLDMPPLPQRTERLLDPSLTQAFARPQKKGVAAPPIGLTRAAAVPRPPGRSLAEREGTPLESAGELTVDARVQHDRFGNGTVQAFEQFGGDTKITVRFDGAGTKTLLLKFAKLRLL